jgi:DNA mismatch endonuclease (patch repair protein)
MVDSVSSARRSEIMSRIRAKDTAAERRVRSALHRAGYRFRLHHRGLPGRPDIVLPKHRTVIFIHGCFWHHHSGCKLAYEPKSRREFWREKFHANAARDRHQTAELLRAGWRVIVVWECGLRETSKCRSTLGVIDRRIRAAGAAYTEVPSLTSMQESKRVP